MAGRELKGDFIKKGGGGKMKLASAEPNYDWPSWEYHFYCVPSKIKRIRLQRRSAIENGKLANVHETVNQVPECEHDRVYCIDFELCVD